MHEMGCVCVCLEIGRSFGTLSVCVIVCSGEFKLIFVLKSYLRFVGIN